MKSNILIFNFNRFKYLMIREWNHLRLTMLTVFGSICGVMILIMIIQMLGNNNISSSFSTESLISTMSIMTLIFSSLAFVELAKTSGRQNYLSIPASHLEKTVSKWSSVAIMIPLAYIIFFTVLYYLAPFVLGWFTTKPIRVDQMEWKVLFESFPPLILAQSVYLLGSVWMPSYSLIKTTLGIFALAILMAILSFLVFRISYYELFDGFDMVHENIKIDLPGHRIFENRSLRYLSGVILFIVLMTTTLFKLREKEL